LEAFAHLPEQDRSNLYRWLIAQPFVHRLQDGRYQYHELVGELFRRHVYQESLTAGHSTRQALVKYYGQLLQNVEEEEGKDVFDSGEWLELSLALIYQLLFLPTKANHIKAIEQVLNIYEHTRQEENILRVLREVAEKQLEGQNIRGARQAARELAAYIEADQAGQSQEAIVSVTKLVERAIHESLFSSAILATLYRSRGKAYRVSEIYGPALDDFDHALTLNPSYMRAYVGRGETYRLLNKHEQALDDFAHALSLDPSYPWTYALRGELYRSLNKYEQALADFARALQLNPQFIWACASRGLTYFLLTKYPQALADFNHIIQLDPQSAWAFAVRGHIFKTTQAYPQALDDFTRALELDPQFSWVYANRGETYRLLSENQRALDDFDHALALSPTSDWVRVSREIAYKSIIEQKQSLQDTDRAPRLDHASDWVFGRGGGGVYNNRGSGGGGGGVGPVDADPAAE
jgi:tetratricopeptide (TPR) repeat protein